MERLPPCRNTAGGNAAISAASFALVLRSGWIHKTVVSSGVCSTLVSLSICPPRSDSSREGFGPVLGLLRFRRSVNRDDQDQRGESSRRRVACIDDNRRRTASAMSRDRG